QLIFHEQITEVVVKNVRSGELDVGVISTPIEAYGIESIPLFYEQFFVYASDDQSVKSPDIKLEDINSAELWILDEGNCFRDQVNDFCNLTPIQHDKKFIYHSNSIDALIRMVDTHGGMTILPELTTMSLSEYQEDNLKRISGEQKAREIGMIVTHNYGKARYISLLEEYIKSNIPHHMLTGEKYDVVDPHIELD
ncbi:MAG: LysR substrate-binding domain-containing protein, partial [Bacteroidota bacterium]